MWQGLLAAQLCSERAGRAQVTWIQASPYRPWATWQPQALPAGWGLTVALCRIPLMLSFDNVHESASLSRGYMTLMPSTLDKEEEGIESCTVLQQWPVRLI